MTGIRNTAPTDTERVGSVALEDVFVSIDLGGDVAYVACEDGSAIRWQEVPRAEGELLVRMGARSEIHLRFAPRIEITPASRAMGAGRRIA